jgi:hypothetical protein
VILAALTAGGFNWGLRRMAGFDPGLAFPLAMIGSALIFTAFPDAGNPGDTDEGEENR